MRFFGVLLLSLIVTITFSLLRTPSFAVGKKIISFVVYLGAHTHGPEVTSSDLEKVTDSYYQLSKNPNVISVFENRGKQLHTTRSWNFLGLESDSGEIPSHSAWDVARYGEDTIIANLDTVDWSKILQQWLCSLSCKVHPSKITANVSARDEDGHGIHTLSTAGGNFVSGANVFGFGNGTAKGGSPKARVAAYKVCWKPIKDSGGCFDADILAAFEAAIHDGVDVISASIGGPPTDYFSDGIAIGSCHAVKHGITVIMSAGNDGPADGSVSNVAPWLLTVGANTIDREFPVKIGLGNKKHLKVCCTPFVQVMLGGQSLYPKALPVRKFYPLIYDTAAKAANSTDPDLCLTGSLDPEKVKGKILAYLRGINGRSWTLCSRTYSIVSGPALADGMILANDILYGNEIVADPHLLPAAHINWPHHVLLYIRPSNSLSFCLFNLFELVYSLLPDVFMTRARTQNGVKPAPVMAAFSSKGPNMPDITGPGVAIIAAYTQAISPAGETDPRRVLFNSESGTSVSFPHVAGVAGLLKTLHPDWSPSAIKSAIMTTGEKPISFSRTQDNQKMAMRNSSNLHATPFSYGSGQMRPNAAMDPGLVYDVTTNDYLSFLSGLGYNETQLQSFTAGIPYKCNMKYGLADFNYPSITVPDLDGTTQVMRTVKNVGSPGTYKARIHAPEGVKVSVEPKTLTFEKIGEEKTFEVSLQVVKASYQYVFGSLTWTDGVHFVRSPIVVQSIPERDF
ncbi:hypothetical protein MKX01_040352 [Papaver californicum]|nr:hypothetical protein MKX01_040352 [Papaver californicum]